MRFNKASLCLSMLLVLGGCGKDPDKKPQLSAITVTCAPASVTVGQSAQCTATATDQDGKSFTVSGYSWESSDASVAEVDARTGTATARKEGTATISASATADGVTKQGQASLSVTPLPQRDPTLHTGAITANETWRAADNPHLVRGTIEVGGTSAPTLTLEAGVEIRFDQDSELRVTNGALRALGTVEAPITMVANQSMPTKGYWRGLVFSTGGSEMNHVMLSDCGNLSGAGACLALENKAAPVLRYVTVRNSSTVGVAVANDGSAFGSGSTTLNVSGSAGYAMRISANQAGTIPVGGTLSDNALNAVELQGNVSQSQTWPSLGASSYYAVNDPLYVEDASGPTLTLAAGVEVRFGRDSGLYVGYNAQGELIVDGAAGSGVLLTADSSSRTPGSWRGVHLESGSSSASRISHATIEYAGADDSSGATGNLNLEATNARPVINDVIVRNGSAYGVYLTTGSGFGPGSARLSAHDNGSYAISIQANSAGTIPTGGTFRGSVSDSGQVYGAVEIRSGLVGTTQTWPNLGIPYVINQVLEVGFTPKATLTLLPGTELRFGRAFGLTVGSDDPGALIAEGTAEAPIKFIRDSALPDKGSWRGLHFRLAEGSKLDHVIVTHAGAAGSGGTGNLNVYREIGAFVTNSTFNDSRGCGITVSRGDLPGTTEVTTNFTLDTYNNTISNNDAGEQCYN